MSTQSEMTQCRTPEEVAQFVRTYSDELVRYAFCVVGEENAAEEVALRAMADYVYRSRTKTLSRAYLWRMVHSRAVDYVRRHRREVPLDAVPDMAADASPEQDALREERARILYRCLRRLPPDYGRALYLHHLSGLSMEDVARVMGRSVKQVYNLLARGKAALKQRLLEEGIDNEDL